MTRDKQGTSGPRTTYTPSSTKGSHHFTPRLAVEVINLPQVHINWRVNPV